MLARNLTFAIRRRFASSLSSKQKQVLDVLSRVKAPGAREDLIYEGKIPKVDVDDLGIVRITLKLDEQYREIKRDIQTALSSDASLNWATAFQIHMDRPEPSNRLKVQSSGISSWTKIIAVSSCKGGVGKSTVAVNLAYSLSLLGKRIGILDADVYGPSLPTMTSPEDTTLRQSSTNPHLLAPLDFRNVKLMSMGFVKSKGQGVETKPGTASILRGPLVSRLISQLAKQTDWSGLDVLVLDLPPGTGDILLTLCQDLKIDGSIIVTTPQKLSYVDVVKGIDMFQKVSVPTLALVENMSFIRCDGCDKPMKPFGNGYLDKLQSDFNIPFAFKLPIFQSVSEKGDEGIPFVLSEDITGKEIRQVFMDMARLVLESSCEKEDVQVTVLKEDDKFFIQVQSGGKDGKIGAYDLRIQCQCAACVDEMTGEPILQLKDVDRSVRPLDIMKTGNYAVRIKWSDGHSSSLYTFKKLKDICGF